MKAYVISIIILVLLMTGCVKNGDPMTPSPNTTPDITGSVTITPENTSTPTPKPTPTLEPVTNVYQAVNRLGIADKASHVFIVVQIGDGPQCDFYAFKKSGDAFTEVFKTSGLVGKNGIVDKDIKIEGDYRTPNGVYTFGRCFGIKDDKGVSPLGYTVVTEDDFWDSNPESETYNQWIKKKDLPDSYDQKKYEHLISMKGSYNYVASINYNVDPVVKGKGSAIFLHCIREGSMMHTGGCIAIPENRMLEALSMIYSDTYIVIASSFEDLLTHVG